MDILVFYSKVTSGLGRGCPDIYHCSKYQTWVINYRI